MTFDNSSQLNGGRQVSPLGETGNHHEADKRETSTITAIYIDNDSEMQSIVSYICELKCPIRMYTVSSENEALQVLDSKAVSVIISEYEFPGYNGVEFLKTLRRCKIDIPVIFFSESNLPSANEKARKNGAFAFISRGGTEMHPFGHLIRTMFEAVHSSSHRSPLITQGQ
jgi:CheY-like chemotaxis protein